MPALTRLDRAITAYDEEGTLGPLKGILKADSPLHAKIVRQVEQEYQLAWNFMRPKIQEWLLRLRLYNNQRRDRTAVGDNTMFNTMNTMLAALYDDNFTARMISRRESNRDRAENLNALWEYDQDEMHKRELDYFWDWDSLFFGRGLVLLNDFNRDTLTPEPDLLDPTLLIRDPRCVGLNGDCMGKLPARFWGREVARTKHEMKENGSFINLDRVKRTGSPPNSLLQEARQARRDAQGVQNVWNWEEALTANYEHKLLQWWTRLNGEPYVIELANIRTVIVRIRPVRFRKWPVVERSIFPMSHEYDGVSVPDLTEDKQRKKAVLLNLGVNSAEAAEYPMYLFDQTKIRNKSDLNFEQNKFIPVDGPPVGAAVPLEKSRLGPDFQLIMQMLDMASEKATATPDFRQGVMPRAKRTKGEIDTIAQGSNLRFSLPLKIFGWSEREFVKLWYENIRLNFKGIDKKMALLENSYGPKWVEFSQNDVILKDELEPYVRIESKMIAEDENMRIYQSFSNYLGLAAPLKPNMRYGIKFLARLLPFMKKENVDRLWPPTPDELKAEDENELLSAGKGVKVSPEEDHVSHLEVHAQAKETSATKKHIFMHREALRIGKSRPDLVPGAPQPNANPQTPGSSQNVTPVPAPQGSESNSQLSS